MMTSVAVLIFGDFSPVIQQSKKLNFLKLAALFSQGWYFFFSVGYSAICAADCILTDATVS